MYNLFFGFSYTIYQEIKDIISEKWTVDEESFFKDFTPIIYS